MKTLNISYIPNTDTYYFPNKEIYIKRWMFLYADADYLATVLGLEDIHTKDRNTLFTMLGQESDKRPDHYSLQFHDIKEQ